MPKTEDYEIEMLNPALFNAFVNKAYFDFCNVFNKDEAIVSISLESFQFIIISQWMELKMPNQMFSMFSSLI